MEIIILAFIDTESLPPYVIMPKNTVKDQLICGYLLHAA